MMKKKALTIIISIILAFAFTLTGCSDGKDMSPDVSKSVAGIEYYHYDTKDFNKMCDELEELAAGSDAKAVLDRYDKLYDEYTELETLYAVIYVMYSTDVKTFIGRIVEKVKSPKRDLTGENSPSSK